MASVTKENYIKTLFFLHTKNTDIGLSELSEALQVSRPSASDMIKKLTADGFVTSERYKPIRITDKGKRTAAFIIRKHRLSELFLMRIMNFGWEEVHDIAEELEHIKVEKFFDRTDELLGFPNKDPHGSPIPDKDGNFNTKSYQPLTQFAIGSSVILRALKDSSSDFLLYLDKKDIQLNTALTIDQIETFDGSFSVSYDDKRDVVLSKSVCDRLLVEKK